MSKRMFNASLADQAARLQNSMQFRDKRRMKEAQQRQVSLVQALCRCLLVSGKRAAQHGRLAHLQTCNSPTQCAAAGPQQGRPI